MTMIASSYDALTQALQSRGFFLVADLPRGTSITRRRGMLVVRVP